MYVFIERVGMHESDSFILRIKIAFDLWLVIVKLNSLIFLIVCIFIDCVPESVRSHTWTVTLQGTTEPPGT